MAERLEFPFLENRPKESSFGLASPQDRLAAAIVDCILLLPLVQFFQAPVRRWILESVLFGNGESVFQWRLLNLLIFVSLFVIYHGIMNYWQGRSIGKRFFGLRVISYQGSLSFWASIQRSLFIFFELLCFGLPFLAVFTQGFRRPLHDRVSDTLVISSKRIQGPPSLSEMRIGKFFLYGASAFLTLFILVGVQLEPLTDQEELLSVSEDCKRLGRDHKGNLEKILESHLSDQLSLDCLYQQARQGLWKKETPIANLAMAISLQDDSAQARPYLEQVCQSQKDQRLLCNYSRWLLKDWKSSSGEFKNLIAQAKRTEDFLFVRLLLATRLFRLRQPGQSQELLLGFKPTPTLQVFYARLSFRNLLDLNNIEGAYWIYKSTPSIHVHNLLDYSRDQVAQGRAVQVRKILLRFHPELGRKPKRGLASIGDQKHGAASKDLKDFFNSLKEFQ